MAKFIIDKKGKNMSEQDGCEKMISKNRNKKKFLTPNQTPMTISAQAAVPKICLEKSMKKKEQELNPFKSNEDFIPLGSMSDDEELPKCNLRLHNTNTKASIWEEIFAMRVVDALNTKGIPIKRSDVGPAELRSLKSSLFKDQEMEPSRLVVGDKKVSKHGFWRKKFNIKEEKPEYRVSEIKRIKGNVDKKKMKKKKQSINQIGEMSKNLEEKKKKSCLNKKTKSKLNKLKKALKKIQNKK